eukprot:2114426-Rhodomonas_salina.1
MSHVGSPSLSPSLPPSLPPCPCPPLSPSLSPSPSPSLSLSLSISIAISLRCACVCVRVRACACVCARVCVRVRGRVWDVAQPTRSSIIGGPPLADEAYLYAAERVQGPTPPVSPMPQTPFSSKPRLLKAPFAQSPFFSDPVVRKPPSSQTPAPARQTAALGQESLAPSSLSFPTVTCSVSSASRPCAHDHAIHSASVPYVPANVQREAR